MASSRKNRAASPRTKAGIGAARAASQARSLPDEEIVVTTSTEADTAVIVAGEFVAEQVLVEEVAEVVAEIITDCESVPIVEVSTPEEILEAEITKSAPLESREVSPIAEIPDKPATTPKPAATNPSRNKSKSSNPKSSVQRPKGDKTMTQETEQSAPLATKKEGVIAKTGSALPVRPVTPSDLTVVGMISSAGERPIGAATIAIFGTYLNGRPIEASSLKLFEILPGDRPVFATEIAYVPGTPLGGRPIMVSPAGLLGAEEVMGNRPIFSNEVDPDSASLMGYLD